VKTNRDVTLEKRARNKLAIMKNELIRKVKKPVPGDEKKEKQELYCQECNNYIKFEIDLSLNGQHIIVCPKCKHKHYRIIEDGIITARRWGQDSSQIQTYYATAYSITNAITYSYNRYSYSTRAY